MLIGCEPTEPLRALLQRPCQWERDWAELQALDRTGRVMAHHVVGLGIGETRPSVLGGSLIDVTLTDGGHDRPSLAALRLPKTPSMQVMPHFRTR